LFGACHRARHRAETPIIPAALSPRVGGGADIAATAGPAWCASTADLLPADGRRRRRCRSARAPRRPWSSATFEAARSPADGRRKFDRPLTPDLGGILAAYDSTRSSRSTRSGGLPRALFRTGTAASRIDSRPSTAFARHRGRGADLHVIGISSRLASPAGIPPEGSPKTTPASRQIHHPGNVSYFLHAGTANVCSAADLSRLRHRR
jgi:hypothetical protein